jgi:hypothetical protein
MFQITTTNLQTIGMSGQNADAVAEASSSIQADSCFAPTTLHGTLLGLGVTSLVLPHTDSRRGTNGFRVATTAALKCALLIMELSTAGEMTAALLPMEEENMDKCICCGAVNGAFPIVIEFRLACDCYNRAPSVPVFRDDRTHLADCPMSGTNFPVGMIVRRPR